jgi:hypothetical protein
MRHGRIRWTGISERSGMHFQIVHMMKAILYGHFREKDFVNHRCRERIVQHVENI